MKPIQRILPWVGVEIRGTPLQRRRTETRGVALAARIVLIGLLALMLAAADTLTLRDGTVLEGKFFGGSSQEVRFVVGKDLRFFSLNEVAQITVGAPLASLGQPESKCPETSVPACPSTSQQAAPPELVHALPRPNKQPHLSWSNRKPSRPVREPVRPREMSRSVRELNQPVRKPSRSVHKPSLR